MNPPPPAYTDLYGQTVCVEKGAIVMEKDKRPQSPGNPPQDVDDLIFSGQTDARISQR